MIARFTGGEAGVLSGLMRNPDQIRNRPMVVDAPSGKGRVILFANNPIYRWQTFGEHAMVFNALLFWNDMASGRRSQPPTDSTADRSRSQIAIADPLDPNLPSSVLTQEFPHQGRVPVVGLEPDVGQRADRRECAPSITSTSTFDSIFDTSDGGGPYCSVRAISVSDTAAPAKLPNTGTRSSTASRPTRPMIGSVIALSMIFASRSIWTPKIVLRFFDADAARLREARDAGEGVRGGAADAAIDDRRHLLRGAHEHPAQREVAEHADDRGDDERDGQPQQQRSRASRSIITCMSRSMTVV